MRKEELDYVLVPLGLALMVGYHAWLLLRIRRRPATTVIGVNTINRRIWVRHIMEDTSGKHAVLAVQTIRNNIMASTLLASTAITLSSLIAILMSSGGCNDGGGGGLLPDAPLVVGAAGETALSVKFFAILVYFLVAFLLNVQSIRYYSHTQGLQYRRYISRYIRYSHISGEKFPTKRFKLSLRTPILRQITTSIYSWPGTI